MIVDFHAHAFPDSIAERAVRHLEAEAAQSGAKAHTDGRVSSLLASMDRAGIEKSVLCSIATKPEQFEPILKWSKAVASDRIVPFPSIHPADPLAADRLHRIADEGFKGVKLHPYYQTFDLAADPMIRLYEVMAGRGLVLVCHTGFDIAFPRDRICDPERIVKVVERVPSLKLVTTHLGSWEDWDEVRARLLGRPIYMDLAYSLDYMSREEAVDLLTRHPADRLIFGTDTPWADQSAVVAQVRALGLDPARERALFYDNAARLLGIEG
jgi:hypothetical protein